MISARLSRSPSPQAAVLVRIAAFAVATVSVVLVPATLFAAVTGHGRLDHAFEIVAVASLLTLATAVAARSVDPLRR